MPTPKIFLAAACLGLASAQPQRAGVSPGGGVSAPQPPPLHETLMGVLDSDKDGSVTLKEATATLEMLGGMMAGPDGKGDPEITPLIAGAKKVAPTLLRLLDADGSGGLSKKEMRWVSDAERQLKRNVLKNLTRDVFVALDADGDESLGGDELEAPTAEAREQVLALVRERFPLPALQEGAPDELVASALKEAVRFLDSDGDGKVDLKEAYKAAATFKRLYLKAAATVTQMGPMLQMFGAMQGGAGGGMGGMGGMGGLPPRGGGGGGGRGRGR